MQERSWNFTNKKEWPVGEWQNEPDKLQFTDNETGLPCLIVRNHSGVLCGYVGVSKEHPYFGQYYSDYDLEAHGGLTFSSFCSPYGENNEQGICHVVDEGEDDHIWWFGFDCGHLGDFTPAYERRDFGYGSTYRNLEYVKSECHNLAKQLAQIK